MDYQNVNQLFNSQRLKSQNKTFVTFPSRQNLSMTYEQFFDAYCQISKFLSTTSMEIGVGVNPSQLNSKE